METKFNIGDKIYLAIIIKGIAITEDGIKYACTFPQKPQNEKVKYRSINIPEKALHENRFEWDDGELAETQLTQK